MILKQVEISGFKSFANRMVFNFDKGITGIVGPNGSGKSNIVDAVRWVLGEQKIKQLRGEKMEDVIFAGTEHRRSQGFAFVALTIDNKQREINYPFDEIKVSRKLYRSGESEYRINDNICRLKDINEIFYDTGIGKEGYSIIGQGQIEQILSGKPEKRRELIDEAIGIVKFKKRKMEAIKKLENDEISLSRIKDILTELDKQLEPLKRQSEKAKKYFDVKSKLKEMEMIEFKLYYENILEQLNVLESKLNIIDGQIKELNTEKEENKVISDKFDEHIETYRIEIEKNNNEVQELLASMSELSSQESTIKQDIVYKEHSIEELSKSIDKNILDINEQKIRLDEIDIRLNSISTKLVENNLVLAQSEIELNSIKNEISQNKLYLEEKTVILDDINMKEIEYVKNLSYEKARIEQWEINKTVLTDDLKKHQAEYNDLEKNISENKKEIIKIEAQLLDNSQSYSDIEKDIFEMEQSINKFDNLLREKSSLKISLTSKYATLENMIHRYDGYSFAVKNLLNAVKLEGVIGVVADIISTSHKYEQALEAALGASLQNIVVRSSDEAKYMISELKKNKWGRCTFLPLDTVKAKKINEKCPDKALGYAVDFIQYDSIYENIVNSLLGSTLVVDKIDDAIMINRSGFRHKIVTLGGDIIQPQGSMTGGSYKNSSSLLSRNRELEELDNEIKLLDKDIVDISDNIKELNEILITKRNEQKLLSDNIKNLSERMSEFNQYENFSLKRLEEIKLEITNINSMLVKDIDKIYIDDNIDFSKEKSLITKEMECLNKCIEELLIKRGNIFDEINKYNTEVASLSKEKEIIEAEFKRINAGIIKLNNEIIEAKDKVTFYKADNIKNNELLIENQKKYEKLKIVHTELIEKNKQLDSKLNTILHDNKTIYEKRDKIASDILDLEKERIRIENQYNIAEEQFTQKIDYMNNEYSIGYSDVRELSVEVDEKQMKLDIKNMKNQIRSFGVINTDAIEEYKKVYERHTFLSTQLSDIEESKKELSKIITSLDIGMKKQFEDNFILLQNELSRVFKILFGGGNVKMELLEPENILESGININAQPPGKKLQNMLQLSGGEKALTAISLMFAIQNLNPSPFCFLDEIEAALDDYNVNRFADYLNKMTEKTQFIVITHRKGTMTSADRLYGITMQEKGVSTMVTVQMV